MVDLVVSGCWPIPVLRRRMSVRNQTRIRVEVEGAIMPENQRQISSGQRVSGADLLQVRVVN